MPVLPISGSVSHDIQQPVGTRSIVYRKSDARNYFEGRFVEHTSALGSHSVSARRAKA
jgi:hypothetical protein